MRLALPEHTAVRLRIGGVAAFVLGAVAALSWLVATDTVALASLYSAEFLAMVAVVAWQGVIRPLRASGGTER